MTTKPSLKVHMTGQIAILSIILIGSAAALAAAIDPIPEEGGFSGRISVGAGWTRTKTNMAAKTPLTDLSSDRINSLFDEPDSESSAMPVFSGELRYTFADTRTQLFLGGSLIDRLRFDLSQAAGVRQQYDEAGIFEGAFLFSGLPTEVWEDPYITGTKREETDRTSTGGRFSWSRIAILRSMMNSAACGWDSRSQHRTCSTAKATTTRRNCCTPTNSVTIIGSDRPLNTTTTALTATR